MALTLTDAIFSPKQAFPPGPLPNTIEPIDVIKCRHRPLLLLEPFTVHPPSLGCLLPDGLKQRSPGQVLLLLLEPVHLRLGLTPIYNEKRQCTVLKTLLCFGPNAVPPLPKIIFNTYLSR
jgi:hypothetical protein